MILALEVFNMETYNKKKIKKIINYTFNVQSLTDEEFEELFDLLREIDPENRLKVHGKNIYYML